MNTLNRRIQVATEARKNAGGLITFGRSESVKVEENVNAKEAAFGKDDTENAGNR